MAKSKIGTSSTEEHMHYSVGAIIKKDDTYLLIDRVKPPLGFAAIAGHIDKGETPTQALQREVQEESGLTVTNRKLLFEEELNWNTCHRSVETHYWYVFECETSGGIEKNENEAKNINWCTKEQIQQLQLEPVWKHWFTKLSIL